VFVGFDKDGEVLFKSEYDAASHFRAQIISQLGAIARAMRTLEGTDSDSKQGTRRELHITWIRSMLNDFYADERPSGYLASDDKETRMLTDLKNVYKYALVKRLNRKHNLHTHYYTAHFGGLFMENILCL
jgi:hypothetical protein